MDTKYFLLNEAARVLDCQPHRIVYLLVTRKVSEPARIGGRRLFSYADLAVLAEFIRPELVAELRAKEGGHA
jgi:hypothetical protein